MTRLTPAEQLLQSLGVTEPKEIDLEAIAFHLGARVRYRALDGCEARIIGSNNAAIITIGENGKHSRQRFSLAHEIGHWTYHKGKTLVCRVEETNPQSALSPERVANLFAADLLMPRYLFTPIARSHRRLTFKAVADVAAVFQTSLTSTAIRLVECGHSPAVLICHGKRGRRWFTRSPDIPRHWFPRDELDAESSAFDVLHGNKAAEAFPSKIGADAWFDRWNAERYMVQEQSIQTTSDEILTLVLITDPAMLKESER